MDENVPESKLTKCKHAVCKTCAPQLAKPECPVCRKTLEATGTFSTQDIEHLRLNEQEEKIEEMRRNELTALAFQTLQEQHELYPDDPQWFDTQKNLDRIYTEYYVKSA